MVRPAQARPSISQESAPFKRTVLTRSIAVALGAMAIGGGVIPVAHAQSNASGNGARRTITPDGSGRFTATAVPPGNYRALLLRDGRQTEVSSTFEVLIGQGSEVVFPGATTTGANQSVVVTGRLARLDTSSSNHGATFTSRQLDALPIARNVDAIIQLALNTTRADPR